MSFSSSKIASFFVCLPEIQHFYFNQVSAIAPPEANFYPFENFEAYVLYIMMPNSHIFGLQLDLKGIIMNEKAG